MFLKLQETRNAKRLRLALKVPLAHMFFFFFFNFYVFSTLHCKPQGTVRQTEQEVGRGQERGVGGDGQATCQE